MKLRILYTALLTTLAGCTHQQLDRSTVLTTSTIMDIQYQIVLRNIAKLSAHPETLPDHLHLADGVVQVNDRVGIGQSGGFTSFTSGTYGFGLDRFGPNAQRQVTEQWGADATTDPQRLTDLQDLYRVALGLQPLPPPHAIAYLRGQEGEEGKRGEKKEEKNKKESDGKDSSSEELLELPPARIVPSVYRAASRSGPSTTSKGGGGSTPSSGGSSSEDSEHRRVPIQILLTDVPPPGWYHIGAKKDVPKNACYVGCYCDRYAWVMPDGIPALARFTVTVLNVIKLKPGEVGKGHGLAVTK